MIGEQLRIHNIEFNLNLEENLPQVLGDKNQIEQVIVNMITNARDAIEMKSESAGQADYSKGVLEVITRNSSNDKEGIQVLVKDTGVGIPHEHLEKLFTPFFTTKPEGKGTGLGLSIIFGIIKDHHGDIDVMETGQYL